MTKTINLLAQKQLFNSNNNKMKLKAIIIEDEEEGRNLLTRMIQKYCNNIILCGAYETIATSIEPIQVIQPDIVFLDIELPNENGFALFDYFPSPTFSVIFTTAYNQFAIKAFKMSAIDYLLKPIDLEELMAAIKKVEDNMTSKNNMDLIGLLKDNIISSKKRIAIAHTEGYDLLDMNDILWLEADSNYTTIYLKGRKITVSKTLKNMEDTLDASLFFRNNRSMLVNINCITQFKKTDNSIVLIDGTSLPLSDARREDFFSFYKKI